MINAVVVEGPPTAMHAAEARLRKNAAVLRVDPDPKINWLLGATSLVNAPLPHIRTIAPKFESSRVKATEPPQAKEIPWGVKRVNAPAAWRITRGQGVKIAVIDTGIDNDHPNLKANVAGGWNAITKNGDFKDDNGHGSQCSGTIAATDGDIGVVGVAQNDSLYGVKVLDVYGDGTYDDVSAGMQGAVQNDMQRASMSLGASKGNDSLKAAVEAMVKRRDFDRRSR